MILYANLPDNEKRKLLDILDEYSGVAGLAEFYRSGAKTLQAFHNDELALLWQRRSAAISVRRPKSNTRSLLRWMAICELRGE